ncbi:response regulator transcription factor [Clostridium sediminicola]|uniref:response regulator n=1 Tax=Clostridium sediminicola TaxID=3114879 RepID=UPI0031F24961
MKIIIADDQVLLRKSIGQLISSDPDITVVDMVGTGKDAIESCNKNMPDIVLMDIEMPHIDGISALKMIKEKHPNIKVIILTTFDNTDNIIESFVGEADGYVVKDIDCEELIATIKCVNYGLTVIHNSVKKIMIDRFKKMSSNKRVYTDILSLEEIEIIRLIVMGKSNKEIGGSFNYTEGTVKNKVSRIYEKLGISDRLQLAVYAVENGIE